MIDVLRVGHATFTTPDLERQVAYYSDVLGLIVTERDKNRAFLATRTGLEAIALERGDKADADAAVVPGRAGRRLCRLSRASCPSTASRASSGTASRRAPRGRWSSPTSRAR